MIKNRFLYIIKKNNALLRLYRLYSWLRYSGMRLKTWNDLTAGLLFLKVAPNTMVSYHGLRMIYDLAWQIEKENIPGDFVECGAWKGGIGGIMAYIAQKGGSRRKVHLFDSFEGLPEPGPEDGKTALDFAGIPASLGRNLSIHRNMATVEDAEKMIFSQLKIASQSVQIHKGWFSDTIPLARQNIAQISLLHLDADWYESTRICLENLYHLVVPAGFFIIDDYFHWEGCRKAVDEFIINSSRKIELHRVEDSVYFQV